MVCVLLAVLLYYIIQPTTKHTEHLMYVQTYHWVHFSYYKNKQCTIGLHDSFGDF